MIDGKRAEGDSDGRREGGRGGCSSVEVLFFMVVTLLLD